MYSMGIRYGLDISYSSLSDCDECKLTPLYVCIHNFFFLYREKYS